MYNTRALPLGSCHFGYISLPDSIKCVRLRELSGGSSRARVLRLAFYSHEVSPGYRCYVRSVFLFSLISRDDMCRLLLQRDEVCVYVRACVIYCTGWFNYIFVRCAARNGVNYGNCRVSIKFNLRERKNRA